MGFNLFHLGRKTILIRKENNNTTSHNATTSLTHDTLAALFYRRRFSIGRKNSHQLGIGFVGVHSLISVWGFVFFVS